MFKSWFIHMGRFQAKFDWLIYWETTDWKIHHCPIEWNEKGIKLCIGKYIFEKGQIVDLIDLLRSRRVGRPNFVTCAAFSVCGDRGSHLDNLLIDNERTHDGQDSPEYQREDPCDHEAQRHFAFIHCHRRRFPFSPLFRFFLLFCRMLTVTLLTADGHTGRLKKRAWSWLWAPSWCPDCLTFQMIVFGRTSLGRTSLRYSSVRHLIYSPRNRTVWFAAPAPPPREAFWEM